MDAMKRYQSMVLNTIASGVVQRLKLCGAKGKSPSLVAKAVDLRKAYKQLAVSSDALVDSYLVS